MPKKPFIPFANESEEREIGGMAVENRLDRATLHGDIDVTMDRAGLANARSLKNLLGDVVARLEWMDLPEHLALPIPRTVKNPFETE